MKVGIIDIEPKIFNTAYMQIASYYKQQGDIVEWWTPITHRQFHVVFCSSLFTYTDKSDIPKDVICGGTGFDVTSRLSRGMEACELDYSIYPNCHKSFVWFSRGCRRNCPWCVVPAKEGKIHPVKAKELNPRGKYIVVSDNDFFGNPEWEDAIQCLRNINLPCDFQGIDIRGITKMQAHSLSQLRHHKRIKFAWDVPDDEEKIKAGLSLLIQYNSPYKLMCYVLIGFNTTEGQDLHRVETLRNWGVDPFVMAYDRSDLYQRSLARYVNRKAIFKKVTWTDYWQRVLKQEKAG